MKQATTANDKERSIQINRIAYILYLGLVLFLVFIGDYEWATINLGIALIFDPFDASIKWQQRPRYQKAWLFGHLMLTFAGLSYLMFR